jgi:hypothetical protein
VAAALAIVLASVALAAWVLEAGSNGVVAQPLPASEEPGPVAQPAAPGDVSLPLAGNPDALTLAKRSRDLLVGLAATPGGPVDVLALPGREPVSRDGVRAWIGSMPLEHAPCGNACFRLRVAVMAGEALTIRLRVERAGAPAATFRFPFPARLPPAGDRLFRAASRRMAALETVQVRETLSSGLETIRTTYWMQAPDRIRFETSEGQAAILIRDTRWDREGRRWVRSPFPGVEAPSYVWAGATNARVLGRARVLGGLVRVLSGFSRRPGPYWFRLFIASDDRVLRAEMLAQSHFMTHRFAAFDAPLEIEAPR